MISNINIINLYTVPDIEKWIKQPENVYVGRGKWTGRRYIQRSKWGNPYTLAKYSDRKEVVRLFKERVLNNKKLKDSVVELKGKVLGCWCAPCTCHAEVLHLMAGNRPVYAGVVGDIMEGGKTNGKPLDEMSSDEKLNLLLTRMDKLDKIDETVRKLDKIDETVTSINKRLDSIETETIQLKEDLLKEKQERLKLNNTINLHTTKIGEIENSCSFVSTKYDELLTTNAHEQKKTEKNSTDISNLQRENTRLKASIDNLKNELEQSKIERNTEQQYHRTSLNIKLCGVPTQVGEEESRDGPSNSVTREVIDLVCKTAGITMKRDAIDVCHRLGRQGLGPIIIRFATKSARFDFMKQGLQKLKGVTSSGIDFSKLKTHQRSGSLPPANVTVTRSKSSHGGESDETKPNMDADVSAQPKDTPIYIQEHLTQYNKTLLNDTRAALQQTHRYPGYVKNGEIRAKLKENDKFVVIKCRADYEREAQSVTRNSNSHSD